MYDDQIVTYASWNGFFEQLQNNTFSNYDINFLNSSLESFCNSLSDTIVFIASEDFEFSSKDVQIPLLKETFLFIGSAILKKANF